ncbi:MAG: hypothetical protein WAM14_11840 [Candidatus Nitrosopolaris sp.]
MVIEGLKYYDISYDEATLKPILTSYFYLQSTTVLDMSMDFIHKSFREYFLAEYYLESILNDKRHYLNVGLPSRETILFLDGLLELLSDNKKKLKMTVPNKTALGDYTLEGSWGYIGDNKLTECFAGGCENATLTTVSPRNIEFTDNHGYTIRLMRNG